MMSKEPIIISKNIDYVEGKSNPLVSFIIVAHGEELNKLSSDDLCIIRQLIDNAIKSSEGKQ